MNERFEGTSEAPQAGTPAPLEVMLRESEGYLPDDGFTARVMGRLPPRRRAGNLRSLIMAAGPAAGGCGAACASAGRRGASGCLPRARAKPGLPFAPPIGTCACRHRIADLGLDVSGLRKGLGALSSLG